LPLHEARIEVRRELAPSFRFLEIEASPKLQSQYAAEKERLFAELGSGDPHTIPRQLHMVGGKAKLELVSAGEHYVGRNNRFKLPNICTYREAGAHPRRIVFEWPHKFLDFADLLAMTDQVDVEVLTTDLKVDRWYMRRYQDWARRVADGYATLHR
jgi:hypothetical protein